MALWEGNKITNIDIGVQPNDGTGDNIRAAFTKADDNFANISNFLSGTSVGFLNTNVSYTLNSTVANFTFTNTIYATGTNLSFTANTTSGNLIANTSLYVNGPTNLNSNLNIAGSVIPTNGGQYDIGSVTNPFRNFYLSGSLIQGATSQTVDAGLLVVHANAAIGDTKDVGIFGNVSHHYSSNTYAFFGYQYQTNNFVYKLTPTNASTGNSVVYDGIYGGAQFGSALLSNSTTSTSTTSGALVVTGGTGIGGNINVGGQAMVTGNTYVAGNTMVTGNIYTSGYQVLSTNNIGYFGTPLTGGIVTGSARFTSGEGSTAYNNGAIAITNGGLGVFGNVNSAGGFYGNLTGTLLTPTQSLITKVGTLQGLTIAANTSISTPDLQATTIGVTSITATTLNVTGSLTGLTSLNVSANITAAGFLGSLYGTVQQPAQPQITSLGTLTGLVVNGAVGLGPTVASSLSTGNAVITGGYIQNLANLTTTTAYITNNNVTNGNVMTMVVGNISSGNVRFSGGYITGLANVGATNGSITTLVSTNISVSNIVATGGYIQNLANVTAVNAYIVNNNVTNSNVSTLAAANISTGNLVASGGYLSGLANAKVVGTIVANELNAATIGNASAVLYGTLNASSASQTNITSVGTLTGLVVNNTTVGSNVSVTANANIILSANTNNGFGIVVTGNILPTSNVTYNVGSSSKWFNTFYGVSSQAQYADLAEVYTSDAEYPAGTVLVFGGEQEVTVTSVHADARVAGAVSTDPAYLMNAMSDGVAVALRGRVPVKVIGAVRKGDGLVTSTTPGYATSIGVDTQFGQAVFAKSIETDLDPGEKVITAVIL